MPYCPTCGAASQGRFCEKCGASLDAASTPAPTYQAGPVAAAGLEDNAAGALCYLVGFITGIIFLVLEPYSKRPFVRFHAFQSILFCVAWFALSMILSIALGVGGLAMHTLWWILIPLRLLIGLLGFLIWLFCMYKAYNKELYQLPIIGPIAAKQAGGQ